MAETRIKEVIANIELGIDANGGVAHNHRLCDCDPEVGPLPCQYCAITTALQDGLRCAKLIDRWFIDVKEKK